MKIINRIAIWTSGIVGVLLLFAQYRHWWTTGDKDTVYLAVITGIGIPLSFIYTLIIHLLSPLWWISAIWIVATFIYFKTADKWEL
jgi:hypothetical protein